MTNEKTNKEKAPKPKYNMWQNSFYMIKLAWCAKEKKVIMLSLLSAACAVLLNLINLYVSPVILSKVEVRAPIGELVFVICAFTVALMSVSALSSYLKVNEMFGRVTVRCEIINLINKKGAVTSYPNVYDDKFTKLLAKSFDCTNSNASSTEAIWTTLTDLTSNFAGFVIYLILLSSVQPVLIMLVLLTTLISYFFGNYVNEWGYRHRDEEAEYQNQMNYIAGRVRDFDTAKDIRIFGLRPWLCELFDKALGAYTAFHKRAEGVYIWARIVDLVLVFFRNAVAYFYLIRLVLNDGLGVGEFLLYFSAVGGFTAWVTGILGGLNTLNKQSLDISTVRECLEYKELFRFDDGEGIPAAEDGKYEIKLENVSFRYPGADADTLSNINLVLHPGEKLAVVGLNGAGKTTLIKLICGFLDPTEGRVLFSGEDIRKFNRREYYKMFSAVFQNFSLLAASVAENVAQSEDEIDIDAVKECIEKAGLKDKVESLPQKYDTKLYRKVYEDAVMLSGGETQRLMLARALYKDAPFVILDEPTAALDPIAESEIYRRYNEMTQGKTSVFISHRLASTRFCDRIILIDGGVIAEEGTHDSLLHMGGKYSNLFEIQSKYYKEGEVESGEQ